MRSLKKFLLLAIVAFVPWQTLYGSIMTVPTGLAPGASYRLVFTTSGVTDASSSDISTYNNFVNNAAAASALNSLNATWKALASTATVNARDNTGTRITDLDTPFYLVNGTKVANDLAQFYGSTRGLLAAPNRTELDTVPGGAFGSFIWTGTRHPGTNTSNRLGENPAIRGDASLTSLWIAQLDDHTPSNQYHLFAVSQVLTAPSAATVPEPASLTLVGMGAVGMMISYCRRKRGRAKKGSVSLN